MRRGLLGECDRLAKISGLVGQLDLYARSGGGVLGNTLLPVFHLANGPIFTGPRDEVLVQDALGVRGHGFGVNILRMAEKRNLGLSEPPSGALGLRGPIRLYERRRDN